MGAATGAGDHPRYYRYGRPPRPCWLHFASAAWEQRSRYLYEKRLPGPIGIAGRRGAGCGRMIHFEESYRESWSMSCVRRSAARSPDDAGCGGKGNRVLLAGAPTGRDGIHGVTFASDELTAETEKRERSPVPLGDGARGKALLEATLEVIEKDLVEGAQDLGGAGLSCALTETAARAGTGIDVDLTEVALGEKEMAAREILIQSRRSGCS